MLTAVAIAVVDAVLAPIVVTVDAVAAAAVGVDCC